MRDYVVRRTQYRRRDDEDALCAQKQVMASLNGSNETEKQRGGAPGRTVLSGDGLELSPSTLGFRV